MDCHDCRDTGFITMGTGVRSLSYPFSEGEYQKPCDCNWGRKLDHEAGAEDRRTMQFTSAQLLDMADYRHKKKMAETGKHRCKSFGGQYCSIWLDEPGRCEDCEKEMGR